MPHSDRARLCSHYFDGYTSDRQADGFVSPHTPAHYPPDLELEPVHLDINLRLDLERRTAVGAVTTTTRARHEGPRSLVLNAVDFLDVAVSDADGRELAWQYDGREIAVTWAEPFAAAEERRLVVSYRIVEPADGLFFSGPDDAYPQRPLYAATDHETERARHWLPCVDLPNVRTTLDFHLRAGAQFTILANGLLAGEIDHGDGSKTAHWRLEQRCPSYLICFAIGEFVQASGGVFDDGQKQIELAFYCSPEHDSAALQRSFGRTGAMIAWMTKKLARPFPFPKYYQLALPLMTGAMENISLTAWTDQALQDEILAGEIGLDVDFTNVHEMSHSYFGDAVVCRDFAHAWLKESWATYMEQCWTRDEASQEEADYVFYLDARSYFQEADERYMRPVVTRRFKSSWQLYDSHLYPGGACRLHTLCRELGDDIFWPAVSDYLRRYDGQVVETDDFRQVMETHSGRSLGRFFDQWFYSPGYPDIKVSFSYDAERQQGTFEIEQQQVDEAAGIPVFALATDLGWTIDGEEQRLPLKIDQAKHVVVVAMPSKPKQVRFDPGAKVLHKLKFNPGDPLLRRQLIEARDVIGRILAAHELAQTGGRTNIQAIVDAYDAEPFWGVRLEFAKALAGANTDAAVAGLAQMIRQEEAPIIMQHVLRLGGRYRDRRLRDALAQRLQEDLPYRARHAAFEAMGAQRQEAQWDVLLAGSRQAGYNGIAQSGAFRGLAATRRDEAVDLLLAEVAYGKHSNRVRPAIVSALADIGRGLEKARREQVVEVLVDLLRDPWDRVRWAAAFGLRAIKAPEAIPALESFGRAQAHQYRVRVDQLVQSLRDADKSDGSALKKQVEELREKVRKLDDSLQALSAKVVPAGESE